MRAIRASKLEHNHLPDNYGEHRRQGSTIVAHTTCIPAGESCASYSYISKELGLLSPIEHSCKVYLYFGLNGLYSHRFGSGTSTVHPSDNIEIPEAETLISLTSVGDEQSCGKTPFEGKKVSCLNSITSCKCHVHRTLRKRIFSERSE